MEGWERERERQRENEHWVLCLESSYLFSEGGSIRGGAGEGLNRIFNSFAGVSFSMLRQRNGNTGAFGIILPATSLLYFCLGFAWL